MVKQRVPQRVSFGKIFLVLYFYAALIQPKNYTTTQSSSLAMYELTKTDFGKHTRFDLRNPLTGHGFSMVPGAGAMRAWVGVCWRMAMRGCEMKRSGSFAKLLSRRR